MWTTIKNLFAKAPSINQEWEAMGEKAVISQHYQSDGPNSGWVDMSSHPNVPVRLLSQLAKEDGIEDTRPDGMYRRESNRVWVIHTVTGRCGRRYRMVIVGSLQNELAMIRLWNRLCYAGDEHESVHGNVIGAGVSHKCKVTGF